MAGEIIVGNFSTYKTTNGELVLYRVQPNFEGNILYAPADAVKVAHKCFADCTVRNIALNRGLRIIDSEAFLCSSVLRLWIPATVTEVGEYGLASGSGLRDAMELYYEGEPDPSWRKEWDQPIYAENARNFHSSSGSWDDEPVLLRTEHRVKKYKEDFQREFTHVSLRQFEEICRKG